MKKIIIVVFSMAAALSLNSAVRRPMLENFTNHTCSFCVQYEPNMTQFIDNHAESLTVIRYHVNWPSSADPFYLDNPEDNNGRKSYYGVTGVPDNYMDGQIHVSYPPTPQALENAYVGAMSEPCYVEINLSGTYNSTTKEGNIIAQIIAEEEPGPGTYFLQISAVSEHVNSGSGYFSSFAQPMRKMYPLYGGSYVFFSDTFPDTVTVNMSCQLDTTWWHYDENEIFFAAWLQSGVLPAKHIYQSSVINIGDLVPVYVEETPASDPNYNELLMIYPNPVSTCATIYFTCSAETGTVIDILDVSGRIVKSLTPAEGEEKIEVDLSDLNTGVYLVKIKLQNRTESRVLNIVR
ncbi:T9SS type A sorting domain-containing protein [candidate division WOR-3 bacterium]|nr:T9SS type A sorting domain-containing protein [candidate division WOR-3 bacterium]